MRESRINVFSYDDMDDSTVEVIGEAGEFYLTLSWAEWLYEFFRDQWRGEEITLYADDNELFCAFVEIHGNELHFYEVEIEEYNTLTVNQFCRGLSAAKVSIVRYPCT